MVIHTVGVSRRLYGECHYEINEDYAHIFNLYIFERYRKRGLAKQLLNDVIKEIRFKGHKGEIQIVTDVPYLKAFYERLGLVVFPCYLED